MISADIIKEHFEYKDGSLYWKKINKYASNIKIGDKAGHVCKINGYVIISLNGKYYREHHLIWTYHYNTAANLLDHINGKKDDNHIENLRECSQQQNCLNQKIRSDNKTGIKGVTYRHKHKKPWIGRVLVNGKHIQSSFYLKEDAVLFVKETREKYHGCYHKHG